MALLTRLTRLLRADLHALLDRMEAPDVLLQQALREMDADLQARQQQQKQRVLQCQRIEQQLVVLEQQTQQFQSELDLCFESCNDALARTFLRRQLETQQRIQQLQFNHHALQQHIERASDELAQQQAQFDSLQLQAEAFTSHEVPVPAPSSSGDTPCQITEADIELALLKAKKERRLA